MFADPQWDIQKFNVATDVARLTEGVSGAIDARDEDLKPFFDRGGKLIQYTAGATRRSPRSPAPRATTALSLRTAVEGPLVMRLFMAPGAHCGGEDRVIFDELTALEQWVEQGKAPDMIPASHAKDGKVDRTRPLCPYPQVASYKGSGSIDEAANFVCKRYEEITSRRAGTLPAPALNGETTMTGRTLLPAFVAIGIVYATAAASAYLRVHRHAEA